MASPGLARYCSALTSPPCTSPGSPAAAPVVAAALLLLGLPALLAPLRRFVALLAEEPLLLGREGELAPAVGARYSLLAHPLPPFSSMTTVSSLSVSFSRRTRCVRLSTTIRRGGPSDPSGRFGRPESAPSGPYAALSTSLTSHRLSASQALRPSARRLRRPAKK